MRINIYSQELTSEVKLVKKNSSTGIVYHGAQLILHSTPMLHYSSDDDDRSAITLWLPTSQIRCEEMARAFETIAKIFHRDIV